jgi:N-acetyl sugar amidotransferase
MTNNQVCTRCVMDTSAADITFDAQGVCSYCTDFLTRLDAARRKVSDSQAHADDFVAQVKADGKGRDYDCVVGVSGGVDSSYALLLAVERGLRPLAVHLDNGWNSELATHNITNLVTGLKVDLYTHVIDWEENRDLQRSFFAAHVVDIELLMDNAMYALNYQQAATQGVKWILGGTNLATEGMAMPPGWNHFKFDKRNIRRIQARFGTRPIKTHPLMSTVDYLWWEYVRHIRWVSFLDYFPYDKFKALERLQQECGYKPYPYKHYESVFTRFYQAYILPRKFGCDKRRTHLATLVASGQMTRAEAVEMLKSPPYPDPQQEKDDREFVLKKLGFTEAGFEQYMNGSPVPHRVYGTEYPLYDALLKTNRWIKSVRGGARP